ncbi:MAG: glycosyltransferase family 39 protein [Candidatus Anstonellales archaeon]
MNLNNNSKTLKLIFLISISFITMFHRLNESPLGYDDTHYAQRAKEVLNRKDYFYTYPTFSGELSFDNKPPVLYWFLSFSGKIFGFNNWSMRLFPAIFGFLTVIFIFLLTKLITKDFELGFWSAFILNFTQQFIYYSRSATPETIFCFFFWGAIFCFYLWLEKDMPIFIYIFGIFLGAAVMTRQIFGLMVLVIIFCYLITIKKADILLNKKLILAICLSSIIFLPWHLFMILRYKKSFIESYLGVLIRYTTSRKADWYEYIKKILENYWPWLPFLVLGITKLKKINLESFTKLILTSIIVYLLFLHIPRFKAPQYLVVMYVPFALVSSYGLIYIDKNFILRKFFLGLSTFLVILWTLFPIIPKTLDSNEYKELQKSFEEIKKINKEIITLSNGEYWHFNNGLLYYLDKKVIGLKEDEFIDSLLNTNNNYYILKWKDFNYLVNNYAIDNKVIIISTQSESVFFTNKTH